MSMCNHEWLKINGRTCEDCGKEDYDIIAELTERIAELEAEITRMTSHTRKATFTCPKCKLTQTHEQLTRNNNCCTCCKNPVTEEWCM